MYITPGASNGNQGTEEDAAGFEEAGTQSAVEKAIKRRQAVAEQERRNQRVGNVFLLTNLNC